MDNERFHSKYHRKNHHTTATAGYPDSAKDPIASPAEPFNGAFHVSGVLSSNSDVYAGIFSLLSTGGTLSSHLGDFDNPHHVTKAQVGLSAVDNYSAADIILSAKDAITSDLALLSATILAETQDNIFILSSDVASLSADVNYLSANNMNAQSRVFTDFYTNFPALDAKTGDFAYGIDTEAFYILSGADLNLSSWGVLVKNLTRADITDLSTRVNEIDTYPVDTSTILYTLSSGYLRTNGSNKPTADIDFNYNTIKNLKNPVDDGDAVSKAWVDTEKFGDGEDESLIWNGTNWVNSFGATITDIPGKWRSAGNTFYILSDCSFNNVTLSGSNIVMGNDDGYSYFPTLKVKNTLFLSNSTIKGSKIGLNQGFNGSYGANYEGLPSSINFTGVAAGANVIANDLSGALINGLTRGGKGGIGGTGNATALGGNTPTNMYGKTNSYINKFVLYTGIPGNIVDLDKTLNYSQENVPTSHGLPGLMGTGGSMFPVNGATSSSGISGSGGYGGYGGGYVAVNALNIVTDGISVINSNGTNGSNGYSGSATLNTIACGGGAGGGGSGGIVSVKYKNLTGSLITQANGGASGSGGSASSNGTPTWATSTSLAVGYYTHGTMNAGDAAYISIAGTTSGTLPAFGTLNNNGITTYTNGSVTFSMVKIDGSSGSAGQNGVIFVNNI